jgi:glyoxylase-like metal-dependent hydrolase (beta-lactamase superfamily II)
MAEIVPIDLIFEGKPEIIGVFLVPYSGGAVLVDPGPETGLEKLVAELHAHGMEPEAVTHILVTHIHLDHSGAAGWFAERGARVLVHPVGIPHLANPGRLLASAGRVYGDRMGALWGPSRAVPEANLTAVQDGQRIAIGELLFKALHTPGHAEHHVCYILDDTCFTGDVGGVRLPGWTNVRLPFVPPETHLGKWRASLQRLRGEGFHNVALTHFGIYDDASRHLDRAVAFLKDVEGWLEGVMSKNPSVEKLQEIYVAWLHERDRLAGVAEAMLPSFDHAAPVRMGAQGLHRYWHKVRIAA